MAKGRAFSCLLNKHAGQEEDTSIFISDSSKGYAAAVEKLGSTEAGRSGEGTVRSAPRALPARGRGRPLSAAPGQRGWDARLRAARAWASRPTGPPHPPLPRFPRQWKGNGGRRLEGRAGGRPRRGRRGVRSPAGVAAAGRAGHLALRHPGTPTRVPVFPFGAFPSGAQAARRMRETVVTQPFPGLVSVGAQCPLERQAQRGRGGRAG